MTIFTGTSPQKVKKITALVRPQVDYGLAVWSPLTKENKDKIEMVQRRASRWVSNDYSTYSSVTEMSNLVDGPV